MYGTHAACNAYKQVNLHGSVEAADPHRLIELLFESLLVRLRQARHAIESQQIDVKIASIGKAMDIVGGLRGSLDLERAPQLAEQLDQLYEYIEHRLVEANLRSDAALVEEVARLVEPIKQAWSEIPPHLRTAGGHQAA